MAWAWHGMANVNQTRPHCVNQMGKTHSKPLALRNGRGTARARHWYGMGTSCYVWIGLYCRFNFRAWDRRIYWLGGWLGTRERLDIFKKRRFLAPAGKRTNISQSSNPYSVQYSGYFVALKLGTCHIYFFCGITDNIGPKPPHCWGSSLLRFLDHTQLDTHTL
jgi:hypothetical protein